LDPLEINFSVEGKQQVLSEVKLGQRSITNHQHRGEQRFVFGINKLFCFLKEDPFDGIEQLIF